MMKLSELKAQNALWYFGRNCGMKFENSGIVLGQSHKQDIDEANISVSDSNGNMLFYGTGAAIYNRKDVVMDKGWALKSSGTSTQGMTFVKLDSGYYMFFTLNDCGTAGELTYGLLNIYLNGGDGRILKKNQFLGDGMDEKQAILETMNSTLLIALTRENERFHIYTIDKNKRTVSFSSSIPTTLQSNLACASPMKISPNGRILAYIKISGEIELFCITQDPFDIKHIGTISNFDKSTFYLVGLEFSPDCSKLYASDYDRVYQFDLETKNIDSINQSKTVLYGPINPKISGFAGLQLGLDKRIYVSEGLSPYLAVVNKPNLKGSGCQFSYRDITIPNCTCVHYLPYFTTFDLNEDIGMKMVFDCPQNKKEPDTSYFLMPNVFTPNGDGINDKFEYGFKNINQFSIYIYNRWGQLVFLNSTLGEFWDGTMNGNQCSTGTYYCVVSYENKGENIKNQQPIILLR